jgi:hypothetical protein
MTGIYNRMQQHNLCVELEALERVARIDDYKESFRLAAERLSKVNLHRLAKLAGADIGLTGGEILIRLTFLGTPYQVTVANGVEVERTGSDGDVSLPEKILICHYLLNASSEAQTGELITFRQIPDGHFYFDAFQRRARDPFLATFGHDPELFRSCASVLGGRPVETGDVGMVFQVLPRIEVQLVLWQGDDEFPPEGSVLFDASIQHRLPTEDIAVLSGMLVYKLMGIARTQQASTRNT